VNESCPRVNPAYILRSRALGTFRTGFDSYIAHEGTKLSLDDLINDNLIQPIVIFFDADNTYFPFVLLLLYDEIISHNCSSPHHLL